MSVSTIGWLFTVGVLIHNAEEAVSLPAWTKSAGKWHEPVEPREFWFVVTVLSALLITLAAVSSVSPPRSVAAYVMGGYVLAMVLNVFIPHSLATLVMRKYMPGTATGLLLNLPLGLWYLSQAFEVNNLELRVFLWAGPATVVTIVASLPILFALGRRLCR
jgi:zinc transporter ZupT